MFSLDIFSDKTFVRMTGISVLLLILSTVFGPLEALLKTTSLDVQQWLVCTCVALSVIVASEIRKAVRRRAAGPAAQEDQAVSSPAEALLDAAD
jgi:Ca2+-transporting ATPase